jgi:hypothetical protein
MTREMHILVAIRSLFRAKACRKLEKRLIPFFRALLFGQREREMA